MFTSWNEMFTSRNTWAIKTHVLLSEYTKILWSTPRMEPKKTTKSTGRVRRFVFTLNNWTQAEYDYLTNEFAPTVKWMIIGRETGENGTPHLQGACILGTQTSFSRLKTLIGFRRAHIESMYGRPEDSRVYCSKQDSEPFESGTLPSPGKRTDLHEATAKILAGSNLRDLALSDELGAVAVVKYNKGLTVLRSLTLPDRTEAPAIFWIFGETGTGKTRCAFKAARRLASDDADIWISNGGLRWFDGYDGQSVVILDDFRSKHVPNFSFFLRLLDRYPFSVEFKGGFVKWIPRYIFITTPKDPDETFSTRKQHQPEDIRQLHRRITKVISFASPVGLQKEGRRVFVETVLSLLPGRSTGQGVAEGDGQVASEEEEEATVDHDVIVID